MKVNPKRMSWVAPTTNTDGTEINYDLEYEVGLLDENGDPQSLMVVAAQLREETSEYQAPIADLQLEPGEHEITMRTFAKEDPDRVSQWSNPVGFVISREIPEVPLDLQVS